MTHFPFSPSPLTPMKFLIVLAASFRTAALVLFLGASLSSLHLPALGQASSNPPEFLTYQGFLVDGNGVALATNAPKNYDVIFRIYDGATAGEVLWAEQQTVTVDNGSFSVQLGEGANIGDPRPALSTLFTGEGASDRYVGITVKGIGAGGSPVEILPRLRLLTSPYAFLAQQAVNVVGTDGTQLLTTSGNTVRINGQLDILGEGGGTVTAASFAGAHTGDGSGLTGVAKLSGGNNFAGDQNIQGHLRLGDGSDTTPERPLTIRGEGSNGQWLSLENSSGAVKWHANHINGGLNWGETGLADGRLFLSPGGNVGIGTTTPEARLHVNGTVAIQGNNALEFGKGVPLKPVDAGRIGYGISYHGLGLAFAPLEIFGGGNPDSRTVKVWAEGGTTFTGGIQLGGGMQLTGDILISNGGRTAKLRRGYSGGGDTSSPNPDGFIIELEGRSHRNQTTRAVWDGDSNWDFTSDRKLKKDIVDVEPLLERTLQVPVRRYRWKHEDADAKHKLGVIAQEVQPLFPDLVTQFTEEDGETTLMVGYSDFGMIAIKAIQELKAQHDVELAGLKAELSALKLQLTEVLRANNELRGQAGKPPVTASVDR